MKNTSIAITSLLAGIVVSATPVYAAIAGGTVQSLEKNPATAGTTVTVNMHPNVVSTSTTVAITPSTTLYIVKDATASHTCYVLITKTTPFTESTSISCVVGI